MKVLWFSNTKANADEYFNSQLKGTGGWLKSLDTELQSRVKLHIAYHSGSYNCDQFKYKKTAYYPIQIYKNSFEKYYSLIRNTVLNEEFIIAYIGIINAVKPDIIHIHGTENPFGCIIGKVDIPVVVSIQGNLTVYSHKYYSAIGKNFLKITKRGKHFFSTSFATGYNRQVKMSKVEQANLFKCEQIIGRTDWDYRITRVLAPDSNYHHVDEILRREFYNNEWNNNYNNKSELVIFTTNSNHSYKGFETICESVLLLNKVGFNIEWRVAGIEKNDLIVEVVKKKLQKKYPKTGLRLLGRLSSKELVENLLESNVYVMPSHIENSPNSLCEAMILGMPCIATFVGGVGSLITDKKEGLLIQDGDPWAMAGAILEMANNPKQAIQLGKNAREVALTRHNKEKIVTDLLAVYKNIMDKQK